MCIRDSVSAAEEPEPEVEEGPEAEPEVEEEPEEEPEVEEEPEAEPEPERPSRTTKKRTKQGQTGRRGRPSKGLTLLFAGEMTRGAGSSERVHIEEVLVELGTLLAQDAGADDYYELDTWKRRDRMSGLAANAAARLGKAIVVCPQHNMTPDAANLAAALRPFATTIVE